MTSAAGAALAIGIHLHDAAASPGNSTLAALPYFSGQAFQYGVDVFMPAADPPAGAITVRNLPRGDMAKPQVFNVPNWRSSQHHISISSATSRTSERRGRSRRARPLVAVCAGSLRLDGNDWRDLGLAELDINPPDDRRSALLNVQPLRTPGNSGGMPFRMQSTATPLVTGGTSGPINVT